VTELRVLRVEAMERARSTARQTGANTDGCEHKIVVDAKDSEEFAGGPGEAGKRVGVSLDFLLDLAGVMQVVQVGEWGGEDGH
jgi:hypothetical protein